MPTGAITLELDRSGGRVSLPAGVTVKLAGYQERSGMEECKGPGVFSLERLD